MTRKDYILIADAIRATQEHIREALPNEGQRFERTNQLRGVRRTAAHLADALAQDNPRFDAAIFLRNCGYGAVDAQCERNRQWDEGVEASRRAWREREETEHQPRATPRFEV